MNPWWGATPSSAAVHTATTPGIPTASSMWIALIVPWATLERAKTACTAPFELQVGDVLALSGEQARILGSYHPSTEHRTVNRAVAQVAVRVAGRVVNGLVGGTSHRANVPRVMP